MSLPRVRWCGMCDAYATTDEDGTYGGHDSRLEGEERVMVPVSAVHTAPCPGDDYHDGTEHTDCHATEWCSHPCQLCNGTGQVEAVHYDPHGILP